MVDSATFSNRYRKPQPSISMNEDAVEPSETLNSRDRISRLFDNMNR
jgi:hypothetical protein